MLSNTIAARSGPSTVKLSTVMLVLFRLLITAFSDLKFFELRSPKSPARAYMESVVIVPKLFMVVEFSVSDLIVVEFSDITFPCLTKRESE